MCALILSYFIVGAMEISPGWMQVEYITRSDADGMLVHKIEMPLETYLDCWDNGYIDD